MTWALNLQVLGALLSLVVFPGCPVRMLPLLPFRCRFAGLEGRARIRGTGQDGLTTNPAAHFVHAQRGV